MIGKRAFIVTLLLLLVLMNLSVLVHYPVARDNMAMKDVHGVIKIVGDAAFTAENGTTHGNGSATNPYVIENWSIDAQGKSYGIWIENTRAHFIIRNCTVYNATATDTAPDGVGIYLDNVTNATIYNNTIYDNAQYNVELESSSNVSIANNTLYDAPFGVLVEDSYSSIHNNTLSGCGFVVYGDESIMSSQNITTDNTVNGRPVYYIKNEDMNNSTAPTDAGQIILGNVTNYIISGVAFENDSIGVFVGYSSNITVENSTFSGAMDAIYTYNVDNVTIANNSISSSGWNGIRAESSENLTVLNNTVQGSGYYGILFYPASNSIIAGNRVFNSSGTNVYLYYSNGNSIYRNIIYGSRNTYGLLLRSSQYNMVWNNTMFGNNRAGIYVYYASNNAIWNNTVRDNPQYGLRIYHGNDNNVTHNLFLNNGEYGVGIFYGAGNIIMNNSFYYNNGTGDNYTPGLYQAYDNSEDNEWNMSVGNYWRDWANNNDTNDEKVPKGIVDYPYYIYGNDSRDEMPLKNTTFIVAPLAPENLGAVNGTGYVNLSWERPRGSGSSNITEYRIYRDGVPIANVSATQLWFNDTTVKNGVVYIYYVTAISDAGEGERSNEVEGESTGEVPELSASIMAILLIISLAVLWIRR